MAIEFHRDGPWELPEGWVWARAADFAYVVGGGTPKNASDEANFDSDGAPWITPADLSGYLAPHISRGARSLSTKGLASCSARTLPAGSLLISSRAPVGYCVVASNEVTTNQGFKSLVFKTQMCSEFFRYYVIYNRKYFIENASGTTFKELSGETMSELLFPVAPIAEQRRIVARIDGLLTEIADGETALARARDDLGTWRRALLKAAVTGELTREWRESNRPNVTGADFVNRIRQAKRSPLRAASRVVEQSGLPELPDDWTWATLPELCISDQRNGISIKGTPNPPGVKALRLDALTTSGLDLAACRYIPLEHRRIDAYRVNAHDFLISRANGSAEFVGRGVYVPSVAEEFVFPDTIIRYPLFPSDILGSWLQLAWNGPLARSQIIAKAKTSAGILKISQDDIAQIAVPVPPELEMIELVKKFQSNAEIAEATQYIDESERDGRKLRQSVLKSAFGGRLAEQDPHDEPADRLLARLGEQREALPPASRSRRRRTATAAE